MGLKGSDNIFIGNYIQFFELKQQVNRENKLVMEDVEQISNPISNGNRILVDYKLNNERTM